MMVIEMKCTKFVKNIKPTENDKAAQVVTLYILSVLSMILMEKCLPQYAASVSAAFTMKALSIIPNRFTEVKQILYSLGYILLGAIFYTPWGNFDLESGYYISLAIGWIVWIISFLVKKIVNTFVLIH